MKLIFVYNTMKLLCLHYSDPSRRAVNEVCLFATQLSWPGNSGPALKDIQTLKLVSMLENKESIIGFAPNGLKKFVIIK